MKKLYSLFAAVILAVSVNAQTVFYSENMGNPTATTTIAANVFQVGAPVDYSGTADVRNTSTSSGYTGASAGGNILFSTTAKNFLITGINSSGYSAITMSFGHTKTVNLSSNELTVEVSSDGTTWTQLTYTRPTGSGTNGWLLISPTGTIPATTTLSIRFTNNGAASYQFRLDDLVLSGTAIPLATGSANASKANLVKNTVVGNSIIFSSKANVQVVNMNGQVVKTASVNENSKMDVSTLTKGTYIVTGNVNGKAVSQKIIKK